MVRHGDSRPRTAVILAGGPTVLNGIRIAEYPKPLLPLGGHRLIDYIACQLRSHGVERLFVTITGSRDMAQSLNADFRTYPLSVDFVSQEQPKGTGGALKALEDRLHAAPFWVVSGTHLMHPNLDRMFEFHRDQGFCATVGSVRAAIRPGEMERVEMWDDHHVKAIHRLHPGEEKRSRMQPAGIFLFEPEVLEKIPREGYYDLKEQLLAKLYDQGLQTGIWEVGGYCQRIISVSDYLTVQRDVLLGRVSFPEMPLDQSRSVLGNIPQIGEGVRISGPVIFGKGCRVGDRATLVGPLVLGDGCEVGPDSLLKDSTVFNGGRTGRGVHLDNCLLTEGAEVGDGLSYRCAVCSSSEEGDTTSRVALFECDPYPAQGDGFPALRLSRPGQRYYFLIKRVLDIAVATVGLVLIAPFWLLIVAAIRLDSPGRAVFRQRRCGQGGKEFWMYKFRTMVEDAEQAKEGLRSNNEVDGPMFKIEDDPRVTALGGFLRASNLDETPQLWNVLRGDLSFVGPRPLALEEMHLNPLWRDIRLSVPQGLTGLWQVKAHSKASFAEWIIYDIEYVNNFSFRQDLRIAFSTGVVTLQNLGRKLGRVFPRAFKPGS